MSWLWSETKDGKDTWSLWPLGFMELQGDARNWDWLAFCMKAKLRYEVTDLQGNETRTTAKDGSKGAEYPSMSARV